MLVPGLSGIERAAALKWRKWHLINELAVRTTPRLSPICELQSSVPVFEYD